MNPALGHVNKHYRMRQTQSKVMPQVEVVFGNIVNECERLLRENVSRKEITSRIFKNKKLYKPFPIDRECIRVALEIAQDNLLEEEEVGQPIFGLKIKQFFVDVFSFLR